MNKPILALTIALSLVACEESGNENSKNQGNSAVKKDSISQTTAAPVATGTDNKWTDALISDYITHTKNQTIRAAVKQKFTEQWMFDQTVNTDTAKYFIFQIGHDVSGDGGKNSRFITDQWLYIDSLTKRVYEYDMVKDNLTLWIK